MDNDDPSYFELNDTGKIAEKYTDKDFIKAVEEFEPASTTEVAEAVGCSRRNADIRLKRLKSEDRIDSKMVGNSLVWLLITD